MLPQQIKNLISTYSANHLLRERTIIKSRTEDYVTTDKHTLINFSSNDYLQLSLHPQVTQAFINGAQQFGIGSGASAIISGYSKYHHMLEEEFAAFLHRERALLFNSGYHANLGVLSTFASRSSTIIADKYCHASLNDGILLSRAKAYRYRHNDYQHADNLLNKHQQRSSLLITESVFSIHGDIPDIKQLANIATKYNSLLVVDDAHAIGVLGTHGKGIVEHFGLTNNEIACLVTPLGKAFGSLGAIVSGSKELIEALLQFARTYRYTIALPPALCLATLTALSVLRTETWRVQKLKTLVEFFIREATARQIKLSSYDITPIKSIAMGSNFKTIDIQRKLKEAGFFVAAMRPPSVPNNEACIRISLNCGHNESQIIYLLDYIADYFNSHADTTNS